MIKTSLLICALVFIFSCCIMQNDNSELKTVRYTSEIKDYFLDGTMEKSTMNLDITYYKKYTLYAVPSISYVLKNSVIKGDTVLNEIVPGNDTTYTYFIIKDKAEEGQRYATLTSLKGTKFKLDSLLELINLDSSNLKVFGIDLGKPYKVFKEHKKISEVYLDRTKNGVDTIYRYFDESLNGLKFSFSPSLDKQKKSKLYKTKLVQFYFDENNNSKQRIVNKTEVVDEIKPMKITNKENLLSFFERFEKMKGS